MKKYKINENSHSSKLYGFLPHVGFTLNEEIEFECKFDKNCLYKIETSDKYDINKLYGFSTSYFHHIQSARVGWRCLDGKSIEYNIIKFKQYFKDYDVQILDNITLRVELENFMLLVEFSNDIAEVIYINPLKLMGEDNRVNGLINLFYPIDFTKLQAAIDSVDLEENINEIFSKEYWTKNLVLEGGSGGHMAHIFDLPQINTGKDLENAFKVTAKHVESNAASVKIDGVNASVRIVNNEFVLDGGSNKPLDVKGVTTQDLENRFGLGHGFIKTGTELIDINTSEDYIKTLQVFFNNR